MTAGTSLSAALLRWLAPILLAGLASSPLAALAHPGAVDAAGCHKQAATGERHCHPERVTEPARYDARRPPKPGDEGVFFGPLINVSDGDTFHAKVQGVVMEFRLSDVDAPEMDQPYGRQARDELRALLRADQLVMVFIDVDRYGRTITDVWIDNLYVNREMAARGAAWFYPHYARNNALFNIEETARITKVGLWALPTAQRVEPWIWRERKRDAAKTKNAGS
jgi:endonuclease YncB( thermonuclease family)